MFPVIGYVLATRRPENSIGWLMLGMGTFFGLTALLTSPGEYLLYSGDRGTALVLIAFDSPSWVPIVVLPVTFLLLLFPDGHLPSPRWRWFAWSLGVALVRDLPLDPARSGSAGGVDRSDGARTRSGSTRSVRSSTSHRR